MRYIVLCMMMFVGFACSDVGNDDLPTLTPLSVGVEPTATFAAPDECLAQASGIDIASQRANAPRTLPNGKPFPGNSPRTIDNANRSNQRLAARVEVMIQFTPESRPNERNQYIREIGGTSRRQIDALNTYIVVLKPNANPSSLPTSPIVLRAEINETASIAQSPPNDARYAEQWSLPVVGLPQGWNNVSAQTVTIAVIDSGVCMNHPDLAGRLVGGYDFVDEDTDPDDKMGHGCGVAGVIAGVGNNGIGIAGIAPNAQIMPIRVLDADGIGNYADIASAIIYATDAGADIINLSLAGQSFSQIMADAVAYAIQNGVIVVAAAGNQGSDAIFYPASFPNVIAVGSIDPDLTQSSFSNYGVNVDMWAPGRDILTTSIDNDYEFMSGTSFAAPIIAGLIAMSDGSAMSLEEADGIAYIDAQVQNPACG